MGQSLANAGFAIGESPWLVRDSHDRVITYIDLSNMVPASSTSVTLTFECRGINPVKVLGFYLLDVDPTIYTGSQGAPIDAAEIIRWADDYPSELSGTGKAGLSVVCKHYNTGEDLETSFSSGVGDAEHSPISYVGHRDSIVDVDQRIHVTFSLVTPSAEEKQISETARYCFGIDIAFIEIPERLQDILVSNGI